MGLDGTFTPETFTVSVRFSRRTSTGLDAANLVDWIMDEMDPDAGDLLVTFDTVTLRNIPTIDAANHVFDHVAMTVVTEPGFNIYVARK